MDIKLDWDNIRRHFNRSFRSNLHFSIASVDSGNNPTVTPIGSLFLNNNQSGFYFEKFPAKLPLHAITNKKICVLAVYSSKWYWLKALFKEKFISNPGIKLYGELGERRNATDKEVARLNRRMRKAKGLKGHNYLWGDMAFVRDVMFTKAEGINLGKMTKDLA